MLARNRLFLIAALFTAALPARAQDVSRLSRDSIINLVSTGTGMAKDAVSLALGDSPAALQKATDYLTAVKVISLAASARDEDAASQTLDWALGKVADAALKETAAGTLLTTVALYKTTLEATREFIVLPKMDENTYRIFKEQRGSNPTDGIERGLAFQMATAAAGSYFTLKQRMYDEMVRSHGWKKEVMGEKLGDWLYKGIDAYWEARMEARWKREWVAEHRDSLLADVWARQKKAIGEPRTVARLPQPQPQPQPQPAQPPTKPAWTSPQDSAIVAAFIAGEEAHVQWLIEYRHKNGQPDFQYRLKWVVQPHVENGYLVFASQLEQKSDADHKWDGGGSTGDAENPMRILLSAVKPWKP